MFQKHGILDRILEQSKRARRARRPRRGLLGAGDVVSSCGTASQSWTVGEELEKFHRSPAAWAGVWGLGTVFRAELGQDAARLGSSPKQLGNDPLLLCAPPRPSGLVNSVVFLFHGELFKLSFGDTAFPCKKQGNNEGRKREKQTPPASCFYFPHPPPLFIFLVLPGYLVAPATCPEIPLLVQGRFGAQEFKEGLEIPNPALNLLRTGEAAPRLSSLRFCSPRSPPSPLLPRGCCPGLFLSHPSTWAAQTFGAHLRPRGRAALLQTVLTPEKSAAGSTWANFHPASPKRAKSLAVWLWLQDWFEISVWRYKLALISAGCFGVGGVVPCCPSRAVSSTRFGMGCP